jgi:CHAT domain-containing protein/tetratricopeptide (TPR) repeat protein
MSQLAPELSEGKSIVASATKLLGIMCLLFWVSSAVATADSQITEQGPTPPVALQTASSEARQTEIRELKPGQVLERELAGGDAHTYRITLTSGQYLKSVVEQKSIDVVVRLFGADGQKLGEVDNSPAPGMESILVVAEVSGDYRLEVRSQNKDVALGRYEVKIEELRDATAKDRVQVAARKAFEEANQLRDQRTAESRRKAIKKYEEALPLWREVGDKEGEASTLNELGLVISGLGDSKKALEYYTPAILLWRALGNRQEEVAVLNNIGSAYWRLGELQKSLEYRNQGLLLSRVVGDRVSESTILSNIGAVYISMGQLRKALEYLNLALPIREALGDKARIAFTLNSIANCYSGLGEQEKALNYYARALVLSRAGGDQRIEATILGNVSETYRRLGEAKKALEYNDQALRLARAQSDPRREAYLLNFYGLLYQDLGEAQKALSSLNQALALWRVTGDKYGEATTLNTVGENYLLSGEAQKALDYLNQALALKRAVGDKYTEAYTLTLIGTIYKQLGELPKALEYLQQALEITRTTGNREGTANVLSSIARVQRALGNLSEARSQNVAALKIIEHSRAKFANQQLRISYLTSRRSLYEFQIDLLMQMHKGQPSAGLEAAALQVSEGKRARSLLEILTEASADIRQGVDPALLERERSVQEQLGAKSGELMRVLSGQHTEQQATAARKEVEALLADYQDVEAQIRAKSPRYAALTQPQPLSLKEIQQQVLDADTLLLEYALGEERSYLWAVTPTSITSYELPRRAEIEAAARRVYDLLVAKADALYPEALTALSRMLLGPVAAQLGRKRLLIVSEGALQYVPFGALPDPAFSPQPSATRGKAITNKYQPLISGHEILNLPSASTLAVLRRELGTRQPAPKTVAALADPVFEKDDQRVRSRIESQQGNQQSGTEKEIDKATPSSKVERSIKELGKELGLGSFDRLVLSRREAELITALASNGQSLNALDFTASRATATSSELNQYQIVHFATHSLLNNQHPELSGIVLSLVDEQGQAQDGFLRLYEVYNLKLEADLVVLSACQTALGKDVEAEGLVGLTRGFMHAGAPRVVASLWKVGDKATAELMQRFYQKMLKDGLRPAAALRAAQITMLKEKQWAAAYYWAGFVLQGEWK